MRGAESPWDGLALVHHEISYSQSRPVEVSLHYLGEMELAIEAGKKWVELAPTTESKSYLALLHTDCGDSTFAQRLGLEVLAQDPENIDANIAVGSASMTPKASAPM